ncbi:MAG: hypothetical protein J0I77_01985 [Rudaea sp.]|uniref:hypothetical protein n=1 Tax=unclassified Rudaea TaxID=2627037 RepID=UPI0010F8268C|nr:MULTISPECIES: hypothetical protein [unclassified Rudaea]MBN8884465.1 hypothetical protein [Rudaea sp.]
MVTKSATRKPKARAKPAPKAIVRKPARAAPKKAARVVSKGAPKKIGKGASWLDVQVKTLRAAAKAARKRPRGRPAGARDFAFKLVAGAGRVEMKTFVSRENRVRVSMPESVRSKLIEATNGRLYTAAVSALVAWALQELKRRKQTLVVNRDDREQPESPRKPAKPAAKKRR